MKRLLLAGAAFLGLAASGTAARATLFDFAYSGSLVDFTTPTTDTYQILAFGAQGGDGTFCAATCFVGPGGRGAEIGGDFSLSAGEILQIAVGGMGASLEPTQEPGGGGGSFVVGPGNTPLVIAGGGGGGGATVGGPLPGSGGLTGPDGRSVVFVGDVGNGGTNGSGGGNGVGGGGGGGGGFFGAGADGLGPFGGGGGGAFPGLVGGVGGDGLGDGGFGGGGGGGFFQHEGAGGGGGYSGGGGGFAGNNGGGGGGGGGSFDAGTDQILVADFRADNGEVLITELATPEPASITLLGASLAALAVVWTRRRAERN